MMWSSCRRCHQQPLDRQPQKKKAKTWANNNLPVFAVYSPPMVGICPAQHWLFAISPSRHRLVKEVGIREIVVSLDRCVWHA
jgi:hypothetical protein